MTINKNSADHNIDHDDFVIFAELYRDDFDEILRTLQEHFENIEYGRQGDDWIWIHLGCVISVPCRRLAFGGRWVQLIMFNHRPSSAEADFDLRRQNSPRKERVPQSDFLDSLIHSCNN